MQTAISTTSRTASIGRRFAGQAIDDVSVIALVVAMLWAISKGFGVGLDEELTLAQAVVAAFLLIAAFASPALVAAFTNGRTFGKLVVGTRVVRIDGERVDLAFAFRREFWSKRVVWGFAFRGLADWNTLRSDPDRRSGHDRDLGTVVVDV
ncbi:MAG: RDD family protein [Solirubrobacterales bacterium]|nr:RDD family protein [Solirubrobacterales bacterium]